MPNEPGWFSGNALPAVVSGDGERCRVMLGRGRLWPSRHDLNQTCLGINPRIQSSPILDPALEQIDLLGRKRVCLGRHGAILHHHAQQRISRIAGDNARRQGIDGAIGF